MKRTPEERKVQERENTILKEVSGTYPVFTWTHCKVCNHDFRREWGWKILWKMQYAYGDVHTSYIYMCKDCADTRTKAWELTKAMKDLKEL